MGKNNTAKQGNRLKSFNLVLQDDINYELYRFTSKCFQKYTTLYDIILITDNYKMGDDILVGLISISDFVNKYL